MKDQSSATSRVKTYEDACLETGESPVNEPAMREAGFTDDEICYRKLKTITEALNEGWLPDFSDPAQKKWWVYTYYGSSEYGANCGLASSNSSYAWTFSYSAVGARLCLKDRATAEYASRTFKSLYVEFLVGIKK